MKKLKDLENIAQSLTKALTIKSNKLFDAIKIPETSLTISDEIKRLELEAQQTIQIYHSKVEELNQKVNSTDHDNMSSKDLDKTGNIITEIEKSKIYVNELGKNINKLANEYKDAVLEENNKYSFEQVENEVRELRQSKRNLQKKRFGSLRFSKTIKELKEEIQSKRVLMEEQFKFTVIPEIEYETHLKENKAKKDLAEKTFNFIISEYQNHFNTIKQTTKQDTFSNDLLRNLGEEYIQKKVIPKIQENLDILKDRHDSYGITTKRELSNPKLVELATNILREGLNTHRYFYMGKEYSEEEKEDAKILRGRIENLPYSLRNIIEPAMADKSTANKEFDAFAKLASKVERIYSIQQIRESIDKAAHKARTIVSNEEDPWISGVARDADYKLRELMQEKNIISSKDFIDLDLEKWDIIKENEYARKLIGDESIKNLEEVMRHEIFSRLTSIQDHNEESIKLGYQALSFKDPQSIVYNTMNFWREAGFSGEMPFLSQGGERWSAINYFNELSKSDIQKVKELNIPGVTEVINLAREHKQNIIIPKNYKEKQSKDNKELFQTQNNLAKLCSYFISNGNSNEKFFALNTITRLRSITNTEFESEERLNVIDAITNRLNLTKKDKERFLQEPEIYFSSIDRDIRNGGAISYSSGIKALTQYFEELETILKQTNYKTEVRKEAEHTQSIGNSVSDFAEDLPLLTGYLKAYSTDKVQLLLNDEKRKETFDARRKIIKTNIFDDKLKIKDSETYFLNEFVELENLVNESDKIINHSDNEIELTSEQDRLVQSTVYHREEISSYKHIKNYFNALDSKRTISKFSGKTAIEKESIHQFSKEVNNNLEELTIPLTRELIEQNISIEETKAVTNFISSISGKYQNVTNSLKSLKQKESVFNTIRQLSSLGDGSNEILEKINEGTLSLEKVNESIYELSEENLKLTNYLMKELTSTDDRTKLIKSWKETIKSFSKGQFDPANELHTNLEYTRFRDIVDHNKIRKHVKNHFTFNKYQEIFTAINNDESKFDAQDLFEIDCVAYETSLLSTYIQNVKINSDKIGKPMIVIPNLSYGYLPVAPLAQELQDNGIESLIGVKIGSTESHENKEVMNSRLFKGNRKRISNEQPTLIVVDGTYNLDVTKNRNKTARYPDAHQGYLNQVIAINDAMGFIDEDYSVVGKTEEDMLKLRANSEFQRTVGVYSQLVENLESKQAYKFELWNTAGMNLGIRGNREIIAKITPYSGEVSQPTMIFCNVGVVDEQIPNEIKNKHNNLTHKPAYFDDSNKIIKFDFGFDNFGVRYLNALETEVKKAYYTQEGNTNQPILMTSDPSIIVYAKNNPSTTSVEERV